MLVFSESDSVKKFICLVCEARFEEEIPLDWDSSLASENFRTGLETPSSGSGALGIFCLKCNSDQVLPFAESAIGQDGCGAEGCSRRVDGEKSCGDCENNCCGK